MRTTHTTRTASALLDPSDSTPALLVSVRDRSEALDALRGGASVIDVKEPSRGPLGAADRSQVEAIVQAVDGRAPVTAAWGELIEHASLPDGVPGVAAYKVGLAGAPRDWANRLATWRGGLAFSTRLVPAAYWDHTAALAPRPESVVAAAERLDGWMVLDTWDKAAGPLPVDDERLARLMDQAHSLGVRVALAGGLTAPRLREAVRLRPALVGVRGAACTGGREGSVDFERVRDLASRLARTNADGLP